MTFIEIDGGRGTRPRLVGVIDDVGASGRVVRCDHGVCGAWKMADGDVILARGDRFWRGPPRTSMVPSNQAFDELVLSALRRLEAGALAPYLGSANVCRADARTSAALASHVDHVRAALDSLKAGTLQAVPPIGLAWLSVADERGEHAAHVEWREEDQTLAVIAGPGGPWSEAFDWARKHAVVAYTRHPDGHLHKYRFGGVDLRSWLVGM